MTKNIKILIALVFALFLLGTYPLYNYINRYNIENDTYYLTHHSLSLPFDLDSEWKSMLQKDFAKEFNTLRNSTLITIDDKNITIQSSLGIEVTELDDEHDLYFFNGWFTLKRSLLGQITLTSLDNSITLYLASTQLNAEMASIIGNSIEEKSTQLSENIAKFSNMIQEDHLIHDFIGAPQALNDRISLKIPLLNQYKFFSQFGGEFIMSIAGIPIDHKNEGTTAYHLQNKDDNISAYIATINTPKELIKLNDYLPKNRVVFQEENGAIFFSNQKLYTAVYIYYDEKNHQQIVAEYQHEQGSIENVTEMYSIFRTLDPAHTGEIFSLESLSLTPEQFENKFNVKIENTFKNTNFFHKLQTKLNEIVNSPMRYTTSYTDDGKDSWVGFSIDSLDLKNDSTFWINKTAIIHYNPMKSVFDLFQQRDPEGKIYSNVFVWSTPNKNKQFSILTEDNGITYEIRLGQYSLDNEENNAQQAELSLLVLLNMFVKQQEPWNINRDSDLTNTAHYDTYTDNLSAPIPVFPVKNGVINDKGKLLLNISDVYRASYIENKYLQINYKYLLDAQGTLLVNNDTMNHIKDDVFIIKDLKSLNKVGAYNFAQKKWIILPIYADYSRNYDVITFQKPNDSWNMDIYLDNLKYLGEAYHSENIRETEQVMLIIGNRNVKNHFKLFDYKGNLIKEIDEDLGYASYSPKAQLYIMTIFKDGKKQYVPMTLQGRLYNDIYSEYHIDNDRIFVKKANEDSFNELRL